MCLARSTPHTGSSGAQGLWSEYTAKPQASRSQRDTGPGWAPLTANQLLLLLGASDRTDSKSAAAAATAGNK